jgi:hypothetical protein
MRKRTCSWVGYAPHQTDSIIRLIREIDPVNVSVRAGLADEKEGTKLVPVLSYLN